MTQIPGGFPEEALEIVRKAVKNFPEDIDDCVKEAEANLRKWSGFRAFTKSLLTYAIREMILDRRHVVARATKKGAGEYGGPAKVVVGSSPGVLRVYRSFYDMPFGGTTLGNVLVADLPGIAETESDIGKGHARNARFARLMYSSVPKSKREKGDVRGGIAESKLRALWRRASKAE